MANPRNDVRFINIRQRRETFKAHAEIVYNKTVRGNTASYGLAVTQVGAGANKMVRLAGAGDLVAGRLEKLENDGNCVVQTHGNCELPAGTGATLTLGAKIIGALGAASARGYIDSVPVTQTAAAAQAARGRIIDATTTTAVVVDLD
jgi:hypothetical protein